MIMLWFVAAECSSNTSTKNCEKGVSFHNETKDINLSKRWLVNIKHENICHQHFEDSCFKRDLEVNIIFFFV